MTRRTSVFVRHVESYDRVRDVGLRGHFDTFNVTTEWWSWLTIAETFDYGVFPNFQSPPSRTPETGDGWIASLDVQVRPTPALQLGTTYFHNQLHTHPGAEGIDGTAAMFDHNLARLRVSYQFTRALSLRTILDYDGFQGNSALVVTPSRKRLGIDVLLTYLVAPGTACYVGYADGFAAMPGTAPPVDVSTEPLTLVGRRIFLKLSRQFRF
jgi:hypothetical protein